MLCHVVIHPTVSCILLIFFGGQLLVWRYDRHSHTPPPAVDDLAEVVLPRAWTPLLCCVPSVFFTVACCTPPPHPFLPVIPGLFCLGAVPSPHESFRTPLDLGVPFLHVLSAGLPLPSLLLVPHVERQEVPVYPAHPVVFLPPDTAPAPHRLFQQDNFE